jgi:hypothetical protein
MPLSARHNSLIRFGRPGLRSLFFILLISSLYALVNFSWEVGDLDDLETIDEMEEVLADISDANMLAVPSATTVDGKKRLTAVALVLLTVATAVLSTPSMPNNQHMYLPFAPSAYSQRHPIAPFPSEISDSCLEAIVASGEAKCKGWDAGDSIDVVWSWVNSSDHVWRYAHDTIEHNTKGNKGVTIVKYTAPLAHFRCVNCSFERFRMLTVWRV